MTRHVRIPLRPLWPVLALAAVLLAPIVMLIAGALWVFALVRAAAAGHRAATLARGTFIELRRADRQFLLEVG